MNKNLFLILILTLAVVAGCQKEELFEEITPIDNAVTPQSQDGSNYVMAPADSTGTRPPSVVPPYFAALLRGSIQVKEGGTIHLEARVEPSNDPTLRVEWLFNGKPISISAGVTTYHNFGYVGLDIRAVYKHHSGTYSVKISNSKGQAISSIAVEVSIRF